jgi:hypothetical protein
MGHPALTEFHHLLDAMRAWANEALTGYKEPPNRHVAVWDLVRDAQGNVSCATQLPYQRVLPTSAHALLAIEAAMADFGRRLVDLATKAGLLEVGLRTMRVSVSASTQPFKHLVSLSHSGVLLWPTDKAMGTEKAMFYLREAHALLAQVPMDADAPRKLYEVDRYRVAAPEPRAAAALHLVQHDPKRLRRILTDGPHTAVARLPIYELVTENGEPLFASLKG